MNKIDSTDVKKSVQDTAARKPSFSLETLSVKELECLAVGASKIGGRPT